MTDRELLELAAKAIGLDLPGPDDADPIGRQWSPTLGLWVRQPWGWGWWAPNYDDGDALRLAVKLGLDTFCRPAQWSECGRIGQASFREPVGKDPCAATRRAIVRAAAEIGKAMQ